MWWRKLDFLSGAEETWPGDPCLGEMELLEQRAGRCLTTARIQEPDELTRFSDLRRLLRVSAWMSRWRTFSSAGRKPERRIPAGLSPDELSAALDRWLLVIQGVAFGPELGAIRDDAPLPRSSLCRLTPFLDKKGILRVGGRLKHSLLTPDERHSIVLPPDSHLTGLVIDADH